MENRLIGDQGPSRIWVRLFEGGSRIARQAQMDPQHTNNSHAWNFDRESCKLALAFVLA